MESSVPVPGSTFQISQEKKDLLENREPISLMRRQIVAMGRLVSLPSKGSSAICGRDQLCSGMHRSQKPPARSHQSTLVVMITIRGRTGFRGWGLPKLKAIRASLVAQWLRICLLMQGTRVRALVWEDPTCHGAAGPVSHNYRACASGACAPQQERPR